MKSQEGFSHDVKNIFDEESVLGAGSELATETMTEKEGTEISPEVELGQMLADAYEKADASLLIKNPNNRRYPFVQYFDHGQSEPIMDHPSVFVHGLIELSKSERDSNPGKLLKFLRDLRECFFSTSDTMMDRIPVGEELVLAARVSRVQELRGLIGQAIMPSLVYRLTFAEGSAENLVAEIDELGPGEQLDVVHQLEAVHANAVGEAYDAELAATEVSFVIGHYETSDKPLMRIVAGIASKRVMEESRKPSLSFVKLEGYEGDSRLESHDATKSLSDRAFSNLPLGYKMIAPAKDVILGMDMAGMPRFAAESDTVNIREAKDFGLRALQAIEGVQSVSFFEINPRRLINNIGRAKHLLMPGASAEELYSEILGMSQEEVGTIISSGANIEPIFHNDWTHIRERLSALVKAAKERIINDEDVPRIDFSRFEELLESEKISPFSELSEDDLVLIAQCMRPEVHAAIEAEVGAPIHDMPFRSLVHLFRFLSSESQEVLDRLHGILGRMPDSADKILNAFFAASEDVSHGMLVIDVCDKLSEKDIDLVLSKYEDLATASADISIEMIRASDDAESQEDRASLIREAQKNLLRRARSVMEEFSAKEYDANTLAIKLEAITADNATFGSIVRALRRGGIKAEGIEGSHMETLRGGQIDDKLKSEMLAAFRVNRLNSDDPEALRSASEAGFIEAMENPDVEFKALFFGESPVVFVRCEPVGEGKVYMGSFNVSPELKGERIAGEFLKEVLAEKNADAELRAEVWHARSLGFYTKAGFEKDGQIENWHGTGESFVSLVIPKGKLATLQS